MTASSNAARMAAGIAAIAHAERLAATRQRDADDLAAARPAPPSITDRPGRGERALAQTVRCPICGVPVGQQCHVRSRSQQPMPFHPARLTAAKVAASDSSPSTQGDGS